MNCCTTLTTSIVGLTPSIPKLFPVFTYDEAIPLKQNNETKRIPFEIWFAHKEIVIREDDGDDEDIDFVSYFPILSLKNSDIRLKTQRAYVEVCRQAAV